MSEETKLPEENAEAKVEEQAETATEVEEKVEEAAAATEEAAEPVTEEAAEETAEEAAPEEASEEAAEKPAEVNPCCVKTGSTINFWKLATVFLLLAWAVQNWRITKAEEEAKKKMPFYRQALSSPIDEENMVMMDEVNGQLAEAQDFVACNPRGIAPQLDDMYESLLYKQFIPGLKDYKVNVKVAGNILTVTGVVKTAKKEKSAEGALIANSSSQFSNVVTLPCAVKADKVKIEKTDNVLTVSMPKVNPTSPDDAAAKTTCCPHELKAKAEATAKKAGAAAKKAVPVKK